jgi:hypothetical protein
MKYHPRQVEAASLISCWIAAKASTYRIALAIATSSSRNGGTCFAGTRHEKVTATDFCER